MRRVILDTNVLVSAILFPFGTPGEIYGMFKRGEIDLIMSADTAEELKRVLKYKKLVKRHGLDMKETDKLVDEIKKYAVMAKPGKEPVKSVLRDRDDEIFLVAAEAGEADYIVSGDDHLLSLKEFNGIEIITPREFIIIISNEPKD